MNSGQAINRLRTLFRPLLSLALLAVVTTWIVRHGTLIKDVSLGLALGSVTVSFFINLINALIIKTIVGAYQGKLAYVNALHISALGSFGNASGGLPIGTGLKFAILHRQSGLKVKEIAAGLAVSAVIISLLLVAGMSVSIWFMDFPFSAKAAPGSLLIASLLLIPLCWPWLKKKAIARLILPLLANGHLARLFAASLLMVLAFVFNYWIIGYFLFPKVSDMQMIFIACLGILAGLGSLLQSVGGVQEISMGLATYLAGARLIDGAQLALVMRFTSLISSGSFLAFFYLLSAKDVNRVTKLFRK